MAGVRMHVEGGGAINRERCKTWAGEEEERLLCHTHDAPLLLLFLFFFFSFLNSLLLLFLDRRRRSNSFPETREALYAVFG